MFDAAHRFSTEVAYHGQHFPHVEPGAHCVLCQQPIDNAAERMKRFADFVQSDSTKVAAAKREQLGAAARKIETARLVFDVDPALSAELNGIEDGLCDAVGNFETAIATRRTWMLETLISHTWNDVPALDSDPRDRLRSVATRLRKAAADLEKASDENKRKALVTQRDELLARAALGPAAKSIIALIDRMRLKVHLETCKDDLKTKAISDKSKEFASNAVTAALKDALDREFSLLGMAHIRTKLSERNDKGKMKYRLLLDLPVANRLDEILSEGEQRAIAIGAFLAELQLADHGGGIVFDDPVSSLDHFRRQNVARRLVAEAKSRQVVVLTHDTTFLGELRDAVEKLGVDHQMQHLEWQGDRPGYVVEGLPWEHKSCMDRIDRLEKACRRVGKDWPIYPSEADANRMRRQYNELRATIERVVQDVVLNGVIERYRDWIKVGRLDGVVGFDDAEHNEIDRLHKRCCDIVDAHDPASAKNAPVPSPKDLDLDLQSLKKFIAAIKARRAKGRVAQTTGTVSITP
jgi:energy-coupling factor transporter ATP-binding protein EcfA2